MRELWQCRLISTMPQFFVFNVQFQFHNYLMKLEIDNNHLWSRSCRWPWFLGHGPWTQKYLTIGLSEAVICLNGLPAYDLFNPFFQMGCQSMWNKKVTLSLLLPFFNRLVLSNFGHGIRPLRGILPKHWLRSCPSQTLSNSPTTLTHIIDGFISKF